MKKNTLRLIVSASVLVVLAGSYALLANQNRIQQAKEDAAESETGIDVSTASADKISSFQLADGDTSFTLTKTDSGWTCVQDKHFPLSGDSADELVNAFVSFNAVRDLGTAQDGEDYGFSSASATVTLTSSDDTSCRLVLGNANSTTGDYYMKREDTNEVYTVSSSLADSFHKTLADLAVIETFPTVSSDNVQSLSVTENNSSLIFASSRTGSVKTWDISRSEDAGKTESTPEKATVNTVTTLIDHLGSLSFERFVDYKDDNKEQYGLKTPSLTLTFQYTEATGTEESELFSEAETEAASETEKETETAEILSGTLYVGDQTEDGSCYVQLAGSSNIYLMSADKLSYFQNLSYDDYPETEETSSETESETSLAE